MKEKEDKLRVKMQVSKKVGFTADDDMIEMKEAAPDDFWVYEQLARNMEIITDSLALMRKTKNPETFFGRYELAMEQLLQTMKMVPPDDSRYQDMEELQTMLADKAFWVRGFLAQCAQAERWDVLEQFESRYGQELTPKNRRFLHKVLWRQQLRERLLKHR